MSKVIYEKSGKIATVTINRPEVMNCIDPETHELLWETWRDFAADDALEVAILTGAANPAVRARLEEFYAKTDEGRAGQHQSPIG